MSTKDLLKRELACRYDNDDKRFSPHHDALATLDTWARGTQLVRIGDKTTDNGQKVGGGLACTGLGDSHNVMALGNDGDDSGLNGGRISPAGELRCIKSVLHLYCGGRDLSLFPSLT